MSISESQAEWNERMALEYQGVLALHSMNREMSIDSAIMQAKANVERAIEAKRSMEQLISQSSQAAPEPVDSAAFEAEPEVDFDVVARMVRLEQVVANLTKGMGMNGLMSDLGMIDDGPETPVVEDGSIPVSKMVIPDGYPMPSDDPSVANEQYAEAVLQLESFQRTLNRVGAQWRDLVIRPGEPAKLAMATLPLIEAVVAEAGAQLNLDVMRVTIPRGLAEACRALVLTTGPERVAFDEFLDWAFLQVAMLADNGVEECRKLKANLQAVGMWPDPVTPTSYE